MDRRESDRPKVAPHPPLQDFYQKEDERRGFVRAMFDKGSRHYTWINHVMSLGSGVWYRRDALRRAGLQPGMRVLDVCVGTGQVARAARKIVRGTGAVVALDASFGMLIEARGQVPIPLVQGYVEKLPFRDEFTDFVTMGYALRHVSDFDTAFTEFYRVLRPGGTLLLIEFAKPRSRLMYLLLRTYLNRVVPTIARIGSRDAQTMMRYFWETIEHCVAPEKILAALGDVGFEKPRKGGQIDLLAEYSARKPV
jgi:demethylmenaquinone methyltransferase/2-methoxy-6-polyprenyl-1,4-benzoquinol methylase